MKCLNCSEEMMNHLVQTKKDQISYDLCEACGSLWLDASELDKMVFQVEGSIESSSRRNAEGVSEPARHCPRCEDTLLDKVFFIGYSDILLDRCRNCGGFWLDGGELDLINRELADIMPVKGKGFSDFVNNTHVPYWHKRIRTKSSQTDFEVEVPVIKGAELQSETDYVCPACGARLDLYTVFGIEVEGCSRCKGILLDKDELRKLKDQATKGSWTTLRWMDDEVEAIGKANAVVGKRSCPKCEKSRMISTIFGQSKTVIDWCPKCHGVWLDRDEFQDILDLLRKKFNTISPRQTAREVLSEIKEIWNGPENKVSEILDAKAAICALINFTIFEHPALFKRLVAYSQTMPIR